MRIVARWRLIPAVFAAVVQPMFAASARPGATGDYRDFKVLKG